MMGFPGSGPYATQQDVERVRAELRQALNDNAGGLRRLLGQNSERVQQQLQALGEIASALTTTRTGGAGSSQRAPTVADRDHWRVGEGVVRIENIPGRRIPFTMSMDLYIGAGTTSDVEQSVTIPQEGPFVAVRRVATFRSAYSYTVTSAQSGLVSRYSGRSYGRFRPISSVNDLLDAQNNAIVTTPNPLAASSFAAAPAFTSSMAGFRSMEFDGLIQVLVQGASYPRQNNAVPSALWSTSNNAPVDLGALDFFERGEQITVRVTPTHPNNPEFGNVAGAAGAWPFLAGQFDPHEGIAVPSALDGSANNVALPADPVVRLPEGILTIAYEGYKILQPTGPVG